MIVRLTEVPFYKVEIVVYLTVKIAKVVDPQLSEVCEKTEEKDNINDMIQSSTIWIRFENIEKKIIFSLIDILLTIPIVLQLTLCNLLLDVKS